MRSCAPSLTRNRSRPGEAGGGCPQRPLPAAACITRREPPGWPDLKCRARGFDIAVNWCTRSARPNVR